MKPGGISLDGVPIDLGKVKTPAFILSTREDHIAPWRSTYAATRLYKGPVKFVLAASGHIAGVVNPPGAKYGHWENEKNPPTAEEWLASATQHPDSVVAVMGALDREIFGRRGAGATARRRQTEADRGRTRLLCQGARRGLTREPTSRPRLVNRRKHLVSSALRPLCCPQARGGPRNVEAYSCAFIDWRCCCRLAGRPGDGAAEWRGPQILPSRQPRERLYSRRSDDILNCAVYGRLQQPRHVQTGREAEPPRVHRARSGRKLVVEQ